MRHDLGGPPGFAVSQARQILRQDLTATAKPKQVTCPNLHALLKSLFSMPGCGGAHGSSCQ